MEATSHHCLCILGYGLIIKCFLVPLDYKHFISWIKKIYQESKKGRGRERSGVRKGKGKGGGRVGERGERRLERNNRLKQEFT